MSDKCLTDNISVVYMKYKKLCESEFTISQQINLTRAGAAYI